MSCGARLISPDWQVNPNIPSLEHIMQGLGSGKHDTRVNHWYGSVDRLGEAQLYALHPESCFAWWASTGRRFLPNNLVSLCGRVDGYAYRTGRQQSGSLELQDRKRVMRRRTISRAHLAALVLAALLAGGALAQMSGPAPVALTADEMKWSPQGALALPGLEQVNLVGEPSKPGPYTIRLKFPAGYKLAPHTHIRILAKSRFYLAPGTRATATSMIQRYSRRCRREAFIPSRPTCRTSWKCGSPSSYK
jgi:hypothetical protein